MECPDLAHNLGEPKPLVKFFMAIDLLIDTKTKKR
jgi:hypothetical protein